MTNALIGQRKYRFALWSLLCGTVLGAAGIFKGSDLLGLAGLVTAIIGPSGATFAWGNRAEHQDKPPVKVGP